MSDDNEDLFEESAAWELEKPGAAPRARETSREIVPADPLQQYIAKIRQYPQLTLDEERDLADLFRKSGDRDAAFRLVTANLMLVVKIAYEFHSQFQNMLDLVQEGNYGLMRAVQKFDPFKGARLSTYAAYWVRAYMLKYILDNWRLVKVGTTNIRRKLLYRLREMEETLSAAGEPVTAKLLAENFGASEKDVIDIQKSIGAQDKSIYQPVEEGSARQTLDVLPGAGGDFAQDLADSQALEHLRGAVERFKEGLKPVELTLIEERILSEDPVTLREIGEKYGVTREAIRQTEERLGKKLKEYLRKELGAGKDGDK